MCILCDGMHERASVNPERVLTRVDGIFEYFISTILTNMKNEGPAWENYIMNSFLFLHLMIRAEHSIDTRRILRVIESHQELLSIALKAMSRYQTTSSTGFIVRVFYYGDKTLKKSLNEGDVAALIRSSNEHALSSPSTSHNEGRMFNTLLLIHDLTSNRDDPHENAIRKWFIDSNVFPFLRQCIMKGNTTYEFLTYSLKAVGNLVFVCPTSYRVDLPENISDEIAGDIAKMITTDHFLTQSEPKMQKVIIAALWRLISDRIALQVVLLDTNAFKYACNLVVLYSNKESFEDDMKKEILLNALRFCKQQAKLELPQMEKRKRSEDKYFDSKFSSGLINILINGNVELKTKAVKVMSGGLKIHTESFAATLFSALDETKCKNVATALFNTLNSAMKEESPNIDFISSSLGLLEKLMDNPWLRNCLTDLARSDGSHFPLNVMFSPTIERDPSITIKLLCACKKLAADRELHGMWMQFRDKFRKLLSSGNAEIGKLASEIICTLKAEEKIDDYSPEWKKRRVET
ncbi:hypothetical protein PMAYCL1PPCAC_25737 [Pristionchus mayeri]|uniref:Uncharacterized protein n=1 Tax=Pristionchus mayeri TaxID=1317129 RepID=A0AAN5I7L1_9BILA|nr:hypothetical protein PMAYCL1PPCAC_25737 [Pristionchus mayeri]